MDVGPEDGGPNGEDERWMRKAVEEGEKALQLWEVPVGCVFVKGGEVVGRGHNMTNLELDATRHAEMVAIDQMLADQQERGGSTHNERNFLLQGCTLYVTCEPCIMCASALSLLGLSRVVFGCPNEKFGGNGSIMNLHVSETREDGKDLWNGYEVRKGVGHDEGVDLFKKFYLRDNVKGKGKKRGREDGGVGSGDDDDAE